MRNIFSSGFNLPPGVSVNMIPGNRPEDEAWENIYDNFWDKERLTKTHIGIRITDKQYEQMEKLYNDAGDIDAIDGYIMAAIEYGMEIGSKQEQDNAKETKYYESLHNQEVRNPKLIAYFKSQKQILRELYDALKGILLVATPIDNAEFEFEKKYYGKFEVYGNRLAQALEAIALAEGKS